jgi:hypothetical protein
VITDVRLGVQLQSFEVGGHRDGELESESDSDGSSDRRLSSGPNGPPVPGRPGTAGGQLELGPPGTGKVSLTRKFKLPEFRVAAGGGLVPLAVTPARLLPSMTVHELASEATVPGNSLRDSEPESGPGSSSESKKF